MSDNILSRVRNLLATAESLSEDHPEAAETYSEKAMALLAKYGIDAALLAEKDPSRKSKVTYRDIRLEGRYLLDQSILANGLGKAMRLELIRLGSKKNTKFTDVRVFGYEADLERFEMLLTSLLLQAIRGVLAAQTPSHVPTVTYRKGWLSGFAARVVQRVEEIERKATQEAGNGTDIVLYDRSKDVTRAFREMYPRVSTGKRVARSKHGRAEGKAAADKADLGQQRFTQRRSLAN